MSEYKTYGGEEAEIEEEKEDNVKNLVLSEIKEPPIIDKELCVKNGIFEKTTTGKLYVNLYPINFTKDIFICEYPFKIIPECHEENIILKILRESSPEIFKKYGYYYRSGNSFFSTKKVFEKNIFKRTIIHKETIDYTIVVEPTSIGSVIKAGQTHGLSVIQERVLYLVIREILSANPNVHFDRDNLYLEDKKKKVEGSGGNYYIHDGYKISVIQAAVGICLAIGVKNKIKGDFTVLDYISNNKDDYDALDKLEGRRFIPKEGSRSQVISYIDYDRNPDNTTRNYQQVTYSYADYYDKIWKFEVKDKKQPLIAVDIKDPQFKQRKKYYVPELCYLLGINEEDTQDYYFMDKINEKTKLDPDNKIRQIEKCINLFLDTTEHKSKHNDQEGENLNTIYGDEKYTSKLKSEYYGIEIGKLKKDILPCHISQPTFYNDSKAKLSVRDVNGVLPVGRENISTDNWICLYTVQAEKISFKLLN